MELPSTLGDATICWRGYRTASICDTNALCGALLGTRSHWCCQRQGLSTRTSSQHIEADSQTLWIQSESHLKAMGENTMQLTGLKGTRWTSHFMTALTTLLKSDTSICAHFEHTVECSTVTAKVFGRARNVLKTLSGFPKMAWMHMMLDIMAVLGQLMDNNHHGSSWGVIHGQSEPGCSNVQGNICRPSWTMSRIKASSKGMSWTIFNRTGQNRRNNNQLVDSVMSHMNSRLRSTETNPDDNTFWMAWRTYSAGNIRGKLDLCNLQAVQALAIKDRLWTGRSPAARIACLQGVCQETDRDLLQHVLMNPDLMERFLNLSHLHFLPVHPLILCSVWMGILCHEEDQVRLTGEPQARDDGCADGRCRSSYRGICAVQLWLNGGKWRCRYKGLAVTHE